MFELDYLTQRLTFTRSDLAHPELLGGYAPTFAGDVAEIPVETARAARGPARRVRPSRPHRRAPVRRRRGRRLGGRDGDRAPRRRRVRPPGRPADACRRGSPARMTIVRRPSVGASMLGGSIHVPPQPVPPRGPARSSTPGRARTGPRAPSPSSAPARWACRSAAQFATHGWSVIAVDVNPEVVATHQRRPLARRRRAGPRRAGRPRSTPQGRLRATLDAAVGRARGGRRRPHRAGHARRGAAARLPLHGRRRSTRSRPASMPGSPSSSRRRSRSATRGGRFAPAPRGGVGPRRGPRLLRRLLAGAALLRRGPREPRRLPQARRRDRPGVDGPRGRASTRASSTPRSWR